MPDTRTCPVCKTANTPGCRFCEQCGHDLAEPADAKTSLEPAENPELPGSGTEELLKTIAEASGFDSAQAKAGWKISIRLGEERSQNVFVMFNGHDDDGNDIVSFLSFCGPADPKRAMNLLRLNARETHGAFTIKTVNGTEYFAVTENRPARSLTAEDAPEILLAVAARADEAETQLSGGRDVF